MPSHLASLGTALEMAFCLQRVLAGLALALVAAAPVQAASPPVIHTSCGPVKGSYDAELDVASFKGIPYACACMRGAVQRPQYRCTALGRSNFRTHLPRAVPPVGDRRWAYPVDIDSTTGCWEGVLDGTAFAPFCVQSGQFIGNAGACKGRPNPGQSNYPAVALAHPNMARSLPCQDLRTACT